MKVGDFSDRIQVADFSISALSESPFSGSLFGEKSDSGDYYFQSLGSGSSGNCSLLISKGEVLIIDAGIGIRTFLKRAEGVLRSDLKVLGILVTHDHGDHIRGAVRIAHRLSIPIYATHEVCQTLRRWSLYSKYEVTAYLREINSDDTFSVGHFFVTAFDVPHDATRNVGYTIRDEAGTFTLITDIGEITPRIRQAIRESNYLVFESNYDDEMLLTGDYTLSLKERIKGGKGHLSNHLAGKTIAEEVHDELVFVALCHLSGNNNTPTLALHSFLGTMKEYGIPTQELITDNIDIEQRDRALHVTVLERNKVSLLYRLRKGIG